MLRLGTQALQQTTGKVTEAECLCAQMGNDGSQREQKGSMKEQLKNWIRAGYACLDVLTYEENRVQAAIADAVFELKNEYAVFTWSVTKGLMRLPRPESDEYWDPELQDEFGVLEAIEQLNPFSVIMLKDYHMFIEPTNAVHVRQIKDLLEHCRGQQKTVILLGCRKIIPPELEREITIVDFPLPTEADFDVIINRLIEQNPKLERPQDEDLIHTYDSLKGQTTLQVENSISISAVQGKAFAPVVLAEEKSQNIRQSGLLEVVPITVTRDDIGGLENYIDHCDQVRGLRRPEVQARYPNLRSRGVILTGPPGTGKSLGALVTASILKLPLYRLDVSKLKGGIVGESETNMRNVLKLLQANAPCVCQMDEIEKMLAGVESSGRTDGGTTSGMFGQLLTEMESGLDGVYFIGTCNDMTVLKPELLRRFDEFFFVDFPNEKEREIIWRIHLGKQGLNVDEFDIETLSAVSDGYTGAEIEKSVKKGIQFVAWKDEDPTTGSMVEAVGRTTPISTTMKEEMNRLRQWCSGRTQTAGRASNITQQVAPKNMRTIDV
ncbi:MAG: AAA family ATPase [Opitutaceae bacterium]